MRLSKLLATVILVIVVSNLYPEIGMNDASPNPAIDQTDDLNNDYFINYLRIPYYAVLELGRVDNAGLTRNLKFASIITCSFFLDQTIRDFVRNELYSGSSILSESLYNFGVREYFAIGFSSVYVASLLINDDYLQTSAALALQSLIITQGFTELSKKTVARARPRQSPHNPFQRTKNGQAFFSGHSSGSWAFLTVIAARYPSLKWVSYGLAASVSASRIYEDAHWTSDVLVGAIAGYGIARITINLNENRSSQLSFHPHLNEDTLYLNISYKID